MTLLGEDSIATGTFSKRLLNLYEVTKRHTKSVNVPITGRRAVRPPLAQEMVLSGPQGRLCWGNGALTAGSERSTCILKKAALRVNPLLSTDRLMGYGGMCHVLTH